MFRVAPVTPFLVPKAKGLRQRGLLVKQFWREYTSHSKLSQYWQKEKTEEFPMTIVLRRKRGTLMKHS